MSRYLSTVPDNLGFYNLGTVWSYPTGGSGPTAYGPTSYFGSDPISQDAGDSIYTAIDLGDFSPVFRSVDISNSHGGLSRKQTTFFKLRLFKPRAIQFTQNLSQFSYTSNTNRNTLLAFYQIVNGNQREELPINDSGYVCKKSSVDHDTQDIATNDYPITRLDPGEYLFLITNDIRYIETTYSITIGVADLDWRFVYESIEETLNFGLVSEAFSEAIDFGTIAT